MGLAEGGLVTKFQFLMVRLKEKHKNHKKTEEIISIPYGAIKRLTFFCSTLLKVAYFNSLWCD